MSGGSTSQVRDDRPLGFAFAYARRGFHVFPLHEIEADRECSCGKLRCPHAGKHPRTQHGVKDSTTDEATIRQWWAQWPNANIGVACGERSNLLVLDVDCKNRHDGAATLRDLELEHGELPTGPLVLTPSGGQHYYFQHEPGIANVSGKLGDGLDIKTENGYVVGVRSVTTGTYRFEVGFELGDDLKPPKAPAWLLDRMRVASSNNGAGAGFKLDDGPILNGTRNSTLFRLGRSLRAKGLPAAVIADALKVINQRQCQTPLDDAELAAITASVLGNGDDPSFARKPEPENTTVAGDPSPSFALGDILIADKFVAQHGDNVRYCPTRGWLIWDGSRWAYDDREQTTALAERTVRNIYREVADATDDDERKELLKLAATYSKAERIKAMLTIARARVAVLENELDRDPFLLNCRNGTVDLRTGSLRPPNRADLISKTTGIEYDADANAPRFERFLAEIFPGHPELAEFVQQALGYSFTGDQREQSLFFGYGPGGNGKTTLKECTLKAAGDYAITSPAEMLLERKFDNSIPTDRADLCGKRFVAVNETGDGRALAEALIKNATGGDEMTARHLYHEPFRFRPTHHFWLFSNHKPNVRGTDPGIWRRINLIPFERKFEADANDKELAAKLEAELSGILSWIVRGAVAWFAEGRLRTPEIVTAATQQYRSEQDVLQHFLADACELRSDSATPSAALYGAYSAWAKSCGEKPWSKKKFGSRLHEKGFRPLHTRTGENWAGIALSEQGREFLAASCAGKK